MTDVRKDGAPAITLQAVAKKFGAIDALKGISAEIHPGRLTGLVGPDGAGKTTLMRLMAGLLQPSAGVQPEFLAHLAGKAGQHLREVRRRRPRQAVSDGEAYLLAVR